MGIVTGYISLLCFLVLAGKFIGRVSGREKVNDLLRRLHKPVSAVFLCVCLLHLVLVLPVLKTRAASVTASGILCLAAVVLLILLCHMIKNGKKRMLWHRALTLVLLAVVVFHIIVYMIDFAQYQKCMESITVTGVDVSVIPDGTYTGEYDAGYIYAKVQVEVKSGRIADIRLLEHGNERGQRAENIVNTIVEEQKLPVDVVTGATNSSLVIQKACENALK